MSSGNRTVARVTESSTSGRTVVRKAKKFSESMSSPSRRKSLQLLQPLAGNQAKLVGSDGFIRLANQSSRSPKRKLNSDGKNQPKKVFRPDAGKNFTIFEEKVKTSPSPLPPAEQEAVDMMTKETPTEKYWEELAEERRVALEETLTENETLHLENSVLKEENEKLKVMADQAEYLADVVETLIGKQQSSEGSDEEDETDERTSDGEAEVEEEDEKENQEDRTVSDEHDNHDEGRDKVESSSEMEDEAKEAGERKNVAEHDHADEKV